MLLTKLGLVLSNTASSAISAVIIILFVKYFFLHSVSIDRKIKFVSVFALTTGVISGLLSTQNPVMNIIKPLTLLSIGIIVVRFLLNLTYPKSAISFLCVMLGLSFGNALIPSLFLLAGVNISPETIYENIPLYTVLNIAANSTAILFVLLMKPIRQLFFIINEYKRIIPAFFLIFVLISTNTALQFTSGTFDKRVFIVISTTVFICCIVAVGVLISVLIWQNQKFEFEQQKFYNESLNQTLQELRHFKHDWNNNLFVMQSMLENQKYDKAYEYLNELLDTNKKTGNTALFNVKNAGLYGILSKKINNALDNDIEVNTKIIGLIENITNVKITELCEIIGIFIDNSIEAAVSENKRIINVWVTASDSYINISISNICSIIPDMSKINKSGYTTKGTGRGEGLNIVKKLLAKNKYVLNNTYYNEDEKMFYQELAIKQK